MTEFDDVIRRLEEERPQATSMQLDEIKQRVRRRAVNPSRKGNQSMKSRFAILAMLVTGMLFSTAGAGLAISGIQDNASVSQYATPVCTPTPTPPGGVNPAENPTGGGGNTGNQCEEGGVLPAEEENNPATETGSDDNAPAEETEEGGVLPAEETQTQPERQVAAQAETSQLPMTGFAAIPVLVGGLALLAGGLVLRRRTTN
ncbi:LPXTG cell wall anchor domain-containing protein [Solirubrobacter taibaiensis]|nr:LPXTG cell wall anchor domain-containing protein [Solirubrobacter taibaiensis]